MEKIEQLRMAAGAAGAGQARGMLELGNALYESGAGEEAIGWWEKAVRVEKTLGEAWRNLGIGYFNVLNDIPAALGAYHRALQMGPTDARYFFERDQLWKYTRESPEKRLAELQGHPELVKQRDDLAVEQGALLNLLRQHEAALEFIGERAFSAGDAGEVSPHGQWRRVHVALGRIALWRGQVAEARQLFDAGLAVPANFGGGVHRPEHQTELQYWNARACRAMGDASAEKEHLACAAAWIADFRDANAVAMPEVAYYSALAVEGLRGNAFAAFEMMRRCADDAGKKQLASTSAAVPVALQLAPDPLHRGLQIKLLEALASWGLGARRESRRIVGDILRDDPNHYVAADLMASVDWE